AFVVCQSQTASLGVANPGELVPTFGPFKDAPSSAATADAAPRPRDTPTPRAVIIARRPTQRPNLRARMTAPFHDTTALTYRYHRSCHGTGQRGSSRDRTHPNVSLPTHRSTPGDRTFNSRTAVRLIPGVNRPRLRAGV